MKTIAKPKMSDVKRIHKQILVKDVEKISEDYFEHSYYSQLLPASMIAFSTLLESVTTVKGWRKEMYIGDQLHRLKVPVGFIWGDADAFESPETGVLKAKGVENYSFEVVENAGHCPWFDQPEACVSLIIQMLTD